jgi:transcriptional regulator with XRE-family HTH domain
MVGYINSAQIRAARGLLGWTLGELAERCGIQGDLLAEIEAARSNEDASLLYAIAIALEAGGVIFLEDCAFVEGGPGVRLRRREACDEGLRPDQLTAENDL